MADTGNVPIVSKEAEMEMSSSQKQPPPDYGSSVQPKTAPPSYDSIMGKIMEAKEQSKTPMHFVGKTSEMACNSVASTLCLVVSLAVPITMVVLGALYMDLCPLERMIPMYLIVSGSLYIAKTLLDVGIREVRNRRKAQALALAPPGAEGQCEAKCEDRRDTQFADWLSGSTGVVIFAFLIAGSVWVYSNFAPSNDPQSSRYCHPTAYYFAFWQITGTYIMIGLVLSCVSCCCVFACTAGCCKAASSRTDCEAGNQ